MSPSRLRATVVIERMRWIRTMIASIRSLPLDSFLAFTGDPHTLASAESYLRRGLEGLFDLGRHILAKGFGRAPAEYKTVALDLKQVGILDTEETALLVKMAGYRNRLTHFYYEVKAEELYAICAHRLTDIERVVDALERWILEHPDRIDPTL